MSPESGSRKASTLRFGGSERSSRVLLKARPTEAQLADRLACPSQRGWSCYLDVADIDGDGWLRRIAERVRSHQVPAGFSWVVEGPLRSLDGEYFDLTRDATADREVLRRIVACAVEIGAEAVVIHCIAPTADEGQLDGENRRRALGAAEAMLAQYVDQCRRNEVVPTIENIPPVLRMRGERVRVLAHWHGRQGPGLLRHSLDRP